MNNQWFSKIAVWLVIALVLFTVFKQFDRTTTTSGQIGYDVAEAAYFHRSLPFDAARVKRANPRLAAARALIEQGGVRLHADGASVTSGPNTYHLRLEGGRLRCTCQWWAENGGQRGPCKHELAARIHSWSSRPHFPP